MAITALWPMSPTKKHVIDGAVPDDIEEQIRNLASKVAGVIEIEKSGIRKSWISFLMEIHVLVQEDISVREGNDIGHEVKTLLLNSDLKITDVSVHIEPNIENPSICID
jgi:divalent metal cation (Fe/Co/Zn/Cd) transporter